MTEEKFIPSWDHLSESQIKSYHRIARDLARRRGYPEFSEEFAQEMFFKMGPTRKPYFDTAWIDFIGAKFGDPKTQYVKQAMTRFVEPINEERTISHPSPKPFWAKNYFKGLHRAVLVLRYEWGFTQREIGDCYGVTESRVNHYLKEIHTQLRAILAGKSVNRKPLRQDLLFDPIGVDSIGSVET